MLMCTLICPRCADDTIEVHKYLEMQGDRPMTGYVEDWEANPTCTCELTDGELDELIEQALTVEPPDVEAWREDWENDR